MTTLIRVPDQFTPGAGATATAATPTCCCCCCCVTSVVTTSAWLAEGLSADLRQAERRSRTAVLLVTLGPVIAAVPPLLVVFGGSWWLREHFTGVELVALLVAALWTLAVPIIAGARRPFMGPLRLTTGATLFTAEFLLALYTVMASELIAILLIPAIIFALHRSYRRADRG